MASIQLLTARTTTNGVPSLATAGVVLGDMWRTSPAALLVASTAGSGTMTVTLRLWGYSVVSAAWHPLGTGADSTKGTINAGAACGETNTDSIAHIEIVDGLYGFERLYAEVTAIGGTATAISVWLISTTVA